MQAKGSNGGSAQKGLDGRIDTYSKSAHEAVDRAADAAGRVADHLGEKFEALQDKRDQLMEMPETWMEGARDYVKEHPFQALGIALAAGYILSMMMRRSP